MKILKLRFKNLNSLAGEWSIDFTSPEYISDGIFAISGPTGAGKSTILDAICLALYGCTPRLENISASTNEIMSRQTGECFAEVVFETPEGRFRSHWGQRRARGKAEGALQTPQQEIADETTGKILASQIRTTRELVEQKTGMDFSRFTQSMMLAQGGFAAFLQASGNERAPILEEITGTEIYSKISAHVFDRQRTEKTELDKLMAENKGITLLSSEEELLVKQELEKNESNRISLSAQKEKLEITITWVKNIEKLRLELVQISQQELDLSKAISEFSSKQKVLLNAQRAANLDGDYASLISLRRQQSEDLLVLKNLRIQTPELIGNQEIAKNSFDAADKQFVETRKANEELFELLKKVRSGDQDIAQTSVLIQNIDKVISQLRIELKNEISKKAGVEKFIDNLNIEIEAVDKYLTDNQSDSLLVAELTGIQATVVRLIESQKARVEAQKRLDETKKLFEAKNIESKKLEDSSLLIIKQHQTDFDNINKVQQEIELLLNGLSIAELRAKKDQIMIHLADLRKIGDFKTERLLLEDNKPCPLCGSLHHPFAEGNIPSTTDAQRELISLNNHIDKIDIANKQLESLKVIERTSLDKVNQIKNQRSLIDQQLANLQEAINSLTLELNRCNDVYNTQTDGFKQILKPFGISQIPESPQAINALIELLGERKKRWQIHEKRRGEIDGDIKSKKNDIKICLEIIKTKESDIETKTNDLDLHTKKLKELKVLRLNLFGDKNADNEEERSKTLFRKLEDAKIKAQEAFQLCNQKLVENRNRIDDLQNKTNARQTTLDAMNIQFIGRLSEFGFGDEPDFISCRLSLPERQQLETEAKMLETRKTAIKTNKSDREKQLDEELQKKLTDESLDKLTINLSDVSNNLTTILQSMGALNEKIVANNQAKVRGAEILQKIESQNKVFARWSKLNSLIGSSDGKRYRNFVQGLTLEIMVSYANNQLTKLSDRYLLIRDKDEPLELNVIDNYQAGEVRSTKNLSGGESFIVSLALALGLSRMSSRNVKIDSLFLDEGFGTLDEETLETALSTLAGLRHDGKIIGVISHVEAMKERINTKIEVKPEREGRSVLLGPGCARKV